MMADNVFEFNVCTEPGCESTSAFSSCNATTLRLWYKFCVEHMNELAIKEGFEADSMTSNTLFVFYKVARTSNDEIEQLATWTSTGDHFSIFTNASIEVAHTSPILSESSKFSLAIYAFAVVEPKQAVTDRRMWVSSIVARCANKGMTESDVVIVAIMECVSITLCL